MLFIKFYLFCLGKAADFTLLCILLNHQDFLSTLISFFKLNLGFQLVLTVQHFKTVLTQETDDSTDENGPHLPSLLALRRMRQTH